MDKGSSCFVCFCEQYTHTHVTLNNFHGFIDIFSLGLCECDLVPLTKKRTRFVAFYLVIVSNNFQPFCSILKGEPL